MMDQVINQIVENFKIVAKDYDANLGICLDFTSEKLYIVQKDGQTTTKEIECPVADGYTKEQCQDVMGKVTRTFNNPGEIRIESLLGNFIVDLNNPANFTPLPKTNP